MKLLARIACMSGVLVDEEGLGMHRCVFVLLLFAPDRYKYARIFEKSYSFRGSRDF